jgi:AbrB family looped-hinge helix DNA binding protein
MRDLKVPIDKAGRLVLPKKLREELSIQPGDILRAEIRGQGVVLTPEREQTGFVRRGKALVFVTPGYTVLDGETVQALLEAERETTGRASAAQLAGPEPRP